MNIDDFPLSPDGAVNTARFYKAYTSALELMQALPGRRGDAVPVRRLLDLTHQIYSEDGSASPFFRASADASSVGSTLWLSRIKSVAEWSVASGSVDDFRGVSPSLAEHIVHTSLSADGMLSIERLLARTGVVLVHQAATPGTKVDGCAFRLASGHAVIGLTLRYPRLDYYYFTLMHEIAHVAMHFDRLSDPIVDDLDEESEPNALEVEANRFARDILIPRNEWRTCRARTSLEANHVVEFAHRIGVAPQIVAGRIRKDLKRFDLFSEIIHAVDVREVLAYA